MRHESVLRVALQAANVFNYSHADDFLISDLKWMTILMLQKVYVDARDLSMKLGQICANLDLHGICGTSFRQRATLEANESIIAGKHGSAGIFE